MTYQHEIDFLKAVEKPANPQNQRKKLSENQAKELLSEFPSLPADFIDYLKEIGHGSFRECQFNVKPFLFDLKDLGLEEHFDVKPSIKFFGDNFSGDFAGFDLEHGNGHVVEFWHEDGSIYETKKSFKEYIRGQMLMDNNGNDLRVK